MATIGASIMSMVFSAFGSLTPLAIGVWPDALNVMRRKTTVTMRKSIMLVSDRLRSLLRPPCPATFFCTNSSGIACIKRLPGS